MLDFNQLFNLVMDNILTICIIAVVAYIIYSLLFKKGIKPFKRRQMTKEVRSELDYLYKIFYNPVNKQLKAGLIKIGFVLGYFPLYWDKSISLKKNLKANKQLQAYVKKHGKIKPNIEAMYCFKIIGLGLVNRAMSFLGMGQKYMLVPTSALEQNKDFMAITPNLMPSTFYNVVVYTRSGKDLIENIAYKMTREEELEELVNYIPKQNYLEVSTAGLVAKARERANIEKEKYKGQVDSAEG